MRISNQSGDCGVIGMGLGIRRILTSASVRKNSLAFAIRKWLFGFEDANRMMMWINKPSVIAILKQHSAVIGENCDIESPLLFHNCLSYENLIVGNDCHIGKNCFFDLRNRVVFEDRVVVSMQSTFLTHQDMSRSSLTNNYPSENRAIRVGRDSYIGANSTILMGVEIGERCVIAAGSVVTRSVPSDTMVAGIPARQVKTLHEDDFNNLTATERCFGRS